MELIENIEKRLWGGKRKVGWMGMAMLVLMGCRMVGELPGFTVSTVTLPVLVTKNPFTIVTKTTPPAGNEAQSTVTPTKKLDTISLPTTTPIPVGTLPLSTCDKINVVEDVTIPDGTVLNPGQIFVKSWRLENAGQCNWDDTYKLVFFGGSALDAPSSMAPFFLQEKDHIDINLGTWGIRTHKAEPGASVDLAAAFRAPLEPGDYTSYWGLVNESMERIDPVFWVTIHVKEGEPEPDKTWSGEWNLQDPFTEERSLQRAVFYQKGRTIDGFFYNLRGNLVLINARAEEGGESVKGEYSEPWQEYSTPFEWKLTDDLQHFQSLTRGGNTKTSIWCGFRQGLDLPEPCSLTMN